MQSERNKAEFERTVFLKFIEKANLPIDRNSVVSRLPPHPDIRCRHVHEGYIAFELTELCDRQLAETIGRINKKRAVDATFMWTSDPTEARVRKKLLNKRYVSDHPMELLCYTNGRTVSPDDLMFAKIQDAISAHGYGCFRRVWLFAGELCKVAWEVDDK